MWLLLFYCLRFMLAVLLPDYLPVTAAADIYSRVVNTAEDSALCGCWRLLRGICWWIVAASLVRWLRYEFVCLGMWGIGCWDAVVGWEIELARYVVNGGGDAGGHYLFV